jgi:hypothetical protein
MAAPDVALSLAAVKSGRLESKPLRARPRVDNLMALRLQVGGVVKETERLQAAIALVRCALVQMARIGSAAPAPPGVDYR